MGNVSRKYISMIFLLMLASVINSSATECRDYRSSVPLVAHHVFSPLKSVVIHGDLVLFLTTDRFDDTRLIIADGTDPQNLPTIGTLKLGFAERMWLFDGRLYIAESGDGPDNYSMAMVDLSNPSRPVVVGRIPLDYSFRDLSVQGDYLYIANEWEYLRVFDISDLKNPVLVANHFIPKQYVRRVFCWDEFLLVGLSRGVGVFDVSDPTQPVLVTTVTSVSEGMQMDRVGDYAIIGHGAGVAVLDMSVPAQPRLVNTYEGDIARCFALKVVDDRAYVSDPGVGVHVLDISQLPEISTITTMPIAQNCYSADVVDDLVVVNIHNRILQFLDPTLSAPVSPIQKSTTIEAQLWFPQVRGDYVLGMGLTERRRALHVYRYDDSGSFFPVSETVVHMSDFVLADNYLYAASYRGMSIVDIADPVHPVVLGSLDIGYRAEDIASDGDLVYLGHRLSETGMYESHHISLIDATNPESPTLMGTSLPLGYRIDSMVFADGVLFVASGDYGLYLMQPGRRASNPKAKFDLKTVGKLKFEAGYKYLSRMIAEDGIAYVVDYRRMYLVDYENVHNPRLLSVYEFPIGYGSSSVPVLLDGYLYFGTPPGIVVVDVSDPEDLKTVGYLPTPRTAQGLTTTGSAIFATTSGDLALSIYPHCGDYRATVPETKYELAATDNSAAASNDGLGRMFPVPANPSVAIEYYLDTPQMVELKIFDLRGRLVRVLESGVRSGTNIVKWDGHDGSGLTAATGVYLVHIKAETVVESKRVTLIR